jgi:hypothetical protein
LVVRAGKFDDLEHNPIVSTFRAKKKDWFHRRDAEDAEKSEALRRDPPVECPILGPLCPEAALGGP